MNFNERLIDLRKSKNLSQDELGEKIGVSRQTVSKWESAQSYPDFQRLVLLSDYYGLTLDELVKGVSVQDVRDKNLSDEQVSSLYNDVEKAKKTALGLINTLAILGAVSIVAMIIFILLGVFL